MHVRHRAGQVQIKGKDKALMKEVAALDENDTEQVQFAQHPSVDAVTSTRPRFCSNAEIVL